MKDVVMKVNQANLVNRLKFSFTNKTTVLGELLQNARRAGATMITFQFAPETKILQVTDDGCGIDSIAALLTVAESGWNAELVASEHPFGLGFLSALYACRHLTVVSKSGRISVNTDEVLSFKPVPVSTVAAWDGKTVLTLVGVDLELEQIESELKRLSTGFSIPVVLNGIEQFRQDAVNSGLHFVDSELGDIYLAGIDNPMGSCYNFNVYLQGLPVYRSSLHPYGGHHILHLDASRFHARLPDRDKLIDETETVKSIRGILKREIEKRLIAVKAVMPALAFVDYFDMLRYWGLLRLLNDVPVVPRNVLRFYDSYPTCDSDVYGPDQSTPKQSLTRAEIEAREVVTFNDDCMTEEGAARQLFAWHRDYLIYTGGLDAGHWLHALIRNLDEDVLAIELVNETYTAYFQGEWVWVSAQFCESYRIRIGNDEVEITEHACYRGSDYGEEVIVPKGDASGHVLKQVSCYRSERDEFQESTHETDVAAFTAFVVANTANDPADALKRLLPGFSGCPSLFGQSFVINLDQTGHVASVIPA